MGLGDMLNKVKDLGKQHKDKVDQGMDKASEAAKKKFGHEEQIDKFTEKGKSYFADDQQQGGQQQEGGGPQGPPPEQPR